MPAIDLDARLKLAADLRRRDLIEQLRNNGEGRTTVDELVDRLDRGGHVPSTDRPPDREELAIQVYHTHLPMLDEFGVVDYDPERGTVQYCPDEQLEAIVDSLPKEATQPDP